MIIINTREFHEENKDRVKIEYVVASHDWTYRVGFLRGCYIGAAIMFAIMLIVLASK